MAGGFDYKPLDRRLLNEKRTLCFKKILFGVRPNKKKPEIPITLPTLNYPATLFHIFIFMQIYAIFYLIMQIYANLFLIMKIYENFMQIFMKFFDKAKTP